MLTLNFSAKATLVSDATVEVWARHIFDKYKDNKTPITVECSTDIQILAFRLLVKEGVINKEDIQFIYNDEILTCDDNGKLKYWPKGFCDVQSSLLARICRRK